MGLNFHIKKLMDNNYKELIIILKKILKDEKKYSNYKIAKEIGVSQSTVDNVLSFKTVPILNIFLKLCNCAGVEIKLKNKN